jgi:uncharacterized protein with ParB-like and HNH nuclease domain
MRVETKNQFITERFTLEELATCRFIIPPYQRPYVWGNEQINKLIDDFYGAFSEKDSSYYVGTVLLYEQEIDDKIFYQLIDGQQRFTTLWLIAASFRILQVNSEIEKFLKIGDELRIDFAIRNQIKSYMFTLLEKRADEKNQYSDSEIENDEYLIHIAKAVTVITGKIKILEDLQKFGNFIYQNVHFVTNTVPENTDLNKLFATINNSGIQLEQSDILKSLLLKNIKTEKTLYSRIWEACENMNTFFERNVKQLFPCEYDWVNIQYDELKEFNQTAKEETTKEEQGNALTIADILQKENKCNPTEVHSFNFTTNNSDSEDDNVVYCRSIITFPQLLLHTYRLFLKKRSGTDFELPFHPNKLVQIFKDLIEKDEQTIKDFLKCLWTVRFVFDKEVVKWIQKTGDKEEELCLTSISKQDDSFSRTNKEKSEISMLQSMLYFTGNYNTHIWLTPYLKRLIDGEEKSLSCLENIDNELSLSLMSDKEATFNLMDRNYNLPKDKIFDFDNYLKQCNGTSFKHYWFQKLEYILWKEFSKDNEWKNKQKFKNYRIASKNSIEHVFPQNHEFSSKKINEQDLHDFGNLVLLNVSQNSSYSNQDVKKKQVDFEYKKNYDSLKLALIYEDKNIANYNEQSIEEHRNLMIRKLKKHYENS